MTPSCCRPALLLLLLLASPVYAAIEAWVDDTEIDVMDTVQLRLRITGTQDVGQPDLSPLEADFGIEGTSQQSQLRMINGQVSSWVDFQLTLRPKRTGALTIPAITVAGQRSEPIRIAVRAVDPALQARIDRLVHFEIELDRSEVYVQAQLLYTRRLYYTAGVQIYGDLPGPPSIDDAVVMTLGETRQNITMRGDTRYGVLEQRYAIFPERSGTLTIPGFSVDASVVLPDGRRGIRVPAPDRALAVLPIPADFPKGNTWLPARSLKLSDRWEPEFDPGNTTPGTPAAVNAGQPLRRTVVVDIEGNSGSAIPPLDTSAGSDLLRQYGEAPVLEDDLFGTHVTGRRTQPESLVPTWGGTVVVPELTVPWWDTEARAVRFAHLPARSLQIAGEPPPPAAPVNAPAVTGSTGPEAAPAQAPAIPLGDHPALRAGLAALLLLALLLVALRVMRRGRRGQRHDRPVDAARAVREACRKGDAHALRAALIHLAMTRYRQPYAAIAGTMRDDAEWQAVQTELARRLYRRPGTEDAGIGPELAAAANRIADRLGRPDRNRRRRDHIRANNVLPPLYGAGR